MMPMPPGSTSCSPGGGHERRSGDATLAELIWESPVASTGSARPVIYLASGQIPSWRS